MAVITNAKMWSMILQMVLLVQCYQVSGRIIKREPYAVQEMSHDFSSGGEISYTPWSDSYSSGGGVGAHFIKSRGSIGIGSGGFFGSHLQGLSGSHLQGLGGSHIQSFSGFGAQDTSGYGSYGKLINEGPHIVAGGKSIELTDEAQNKIKTLLLESKINLKLAEDKVEKMRKNFGYGTFGYQGYEYPIKPGPIDLGTHHGIDLGTTLDSNSVKDAHGKLKLPVQTVVITKTVGVPIPEPYPIKHEVAVPAPYPVPVPSHYSGDSYPSSYSSDYSGDSGKSSYQNSGSSISKVVSYHENLPKSTEKHYASASTNYARYLPSQSSASSSSAYRTSFTPSTYYSPKQSVYEF